MSLVVKVRLDLLQRVWRAVVVINGGAIDDLSENHYVNRPAFMASITAVK